MKMFSLPPIGNAPIKRDSDKDEDMFDPKYSNQKQNNHE